MSEFNSEDLDAVISEAKSSLVQMLALQLKNQLKHGAELAVQLANADSKCGELAAENAKKSRCLGFFASVIKSGESWTRVCQHEYNEAQETPATDAFLAEVRAQESAPLVRALTVIANSEQHDGETVVCDFDTLISVAAGALRDHYADQLRKGVQS